MLDCYVLGKTNRNAPEKPVPVISVHETNYAPGGAANVAMNIAQLGAQVKLIGILGDDNEMHRLHQILQEYKIDTSGLVCDPRRPTTIKTRIYANTKYIARIDRETTEAISSVFASELRSIALSMLKDAHAVVISDYAKGVTTLELIHPIIKEATKLAVPVVVASKGIDYEKYKGASILVSNRYEALGWMGDSNEQEESNNRLEAVADKIIKQLRCKAVLITEDEDGLTYFAQDGFTIHLPSATHNALDVTGAGDTLLAIFTLLFASKVSILNCCYIANWAASIVVERFGTASISTKDLINYQGFHDPDD